MWRRGSAWFVGVVLAYSIDRYIEIMFPNFFPDVTASQWLFVIIVCLFLLLVIFLGPVIYRWSVGRSANNRSGCFNNEIEKTDQNSDLWPSRVVIHGNVTIIENQYNNIDGRYHAEIDGRARIVSPVPVRLTADPLLLKGTGHLGVKESDDRSQKTYHHD